MKTKGKNNINNNNNNNNIQNYSKNHHDKYPDVSQIMLYFIDKQPYEQVEPVWKSYRKSPSFIYNYYSFKFCSTVFSTCVFN